VIGQVILGVCVLGLMALPLNAHASLTQLSPTLAKQAKTGQQAVLLDFYAKWCGWCQKMAPVVKQTQQQSRGKLAVLHLDVDDPKNAAVVSQYTVDTVPTYYMYTAQGQLSGKMTDGLDEPVFKTLVQQSTRQLVAMPPLDGVKVSADALHWVVVTDTLAGHLALTERIKQTLGQQVRVHPVLPTQAGAGPWLKRAKVLAKPGAGVLLDRYGQVLYRATPQTSDKTVLYYLTMFAKAQP
jgi:thioredoxin 1